MSRLLTVNYNKKPSYDIVIGTDYSELSDRVKALGFESKKAVIITDSKVKDLHVESVKTELEKVCSNVFVYAFEAGEPSKNLNTVQDIIRFMIENKLNRNDLAVAVGGGVVGDIAGFCASIYLRGIEFIQIPTTLLAQVDSSIGGKTGVDFDQYKNMVGAFKMPKLVYINTKTLSTLDARQFYAGMAEVMKYGLIMDESFFEWLISKMYEIHDRDDATLEEMIETCCICKQKIVERDPLEKGDRALLNFGHTIGHAIEKYKNFELLHGECVALGCVAASYISWQKNKLSKDEYYEIRDMFVPFNLPISIDDLEPEKIVDLTKSDKKSIDGGIKFILLKRVGKAYIDQTVTDEEMIAGINEINFTEEDEKA